MPAAIKSFQKERSNSLVDVEALGILMWRWNLTTDEVGFSNAWYLFTGYPKQSFPSGASWFEKIHPDQRARVSESTNACINGDIQRYEEEFAYLMADGSYRWIRSRGQISKRDPNGTALEMFGFYTDIHERKRMELELAESDTRWRQAIDLVCVGVWDWNIKSGVTYFSPEWSRMLGYADGLNATIDTWRELAHPDDLEKSDKEIAAYLAGETNEYECVCRIKTKSGEYKWILDRGKIIERDDDGTPLRLVGTHYDITKQKLQSLEIEETNNRIREITRLVPGFVFQYKRWPDGRDCVPYASEGILDTYGFEPAAVALDSTRVRELIHPDDINDVLASIARSELERIPWQCDYRIRRPDGNYRWYRVSTSTPTQQRDGANLWHGYVQDVNVLKEAEFAEQEHKRALIFQSTHDELTGLPNRRLFMDRLNQRIAGAKRNNEAFALLMLDLDMFKSINDSLGHSAGDALLVEVGQRLMLQARESDTFARLGGDEFAVILADSRSAHGAISVVNRLVSSFSKSMLIENQRIPIEASIGVVMYPFHGETAEQLLAHADEAMYESKRLNIPFQVYSSSDDTEIHENAKISLEISCLGDPDKVDVVYQPIYDLSTRQIVGAEALARWRHPTLGDISPAKFIPIVDSSKYCHAFSIIVLNKALNQVRQLLRNGHDIPISVNISPPAVTKSGFMDSVLSLISMNGLSPHHLILEITETTNFLNFERAMNVLRELAEAGIGISIDDFGTGYTSIRYLRDFPAKELKIDRSYIENIVKEKRYYSIVSSMVELAKGIGASTVAEGIETRELLDAAVELGCDLGQGYLFSKPVPAAQFESLLPSPNDALLKEVS